MENTPPSATEPFAQPEPSPAQTGPELFSSKAIGVGAFLGGPLAATVLIARNFHKLGKKRSRNRTYLLGLGITLSYFWLIFEIPARIADRIPSAIYGGVVSLIAYMLTENLQGQILKSHFSNFGKKASGWAVAGWSLSCAVVSFGLMFLYIPMLPPFVFEEKAYSEGLLGNEIYHSPTIDQPTLERLGNYLIEIEYFDSEYAVPIQLLAEGNAYHLTLPCMQSVWKDEETIRAFKDLAKDLEASILFRPVSISLIDEDLRGTHRKKL